MGIHDSSLDRRVVHECDGAPPVGAEPVDHRRENFRAEWVVEVDNQVAAVEREGRGVGTNQANIAAGAFASKCGAVGLGNLDERRRDLDADDLAERTPCRLQHHAAEAGADVHQRRALRRQWHRIEQAVDVRDRRRLVVGREFQTRPDRFRIEFAEKDQCFGRDAVRGIEALPRALAQWTSALASVRSTPSAANSGPSLRTAASVAGRG